MVGSLVGPERVVPTIAPRLGYRVRDTRVCGRIRARLVRAGDGLDPSVTGPAPGTANGVSRMSTEDPDRVAPPTIRMKRLETVRHMSPEELDALPIGAIKIDREGVVLAYNASEARLARRDPGEVIGRHFFTEVAPCTNVQEFAGRFWKGVERGWTHEIFPFVFPFPHGTVHVMITIEYEADANQAWIFVETFGPTGPAAKG
jgi:photoactive yellow protein